MGKKRVMVPAEKLDLSTVKYEHEVIKAPHLTGLMLKLFVRIIEAPVIGSLIISLLKKQNKIVEMLQNTVIPEAPMFKPEFPPQEAEPSVVIVDEEGKPEDRVESALKCLPHYDPASCWSGDSLPSFRYWKIRDYAYAYRSKLVTPSMVAEQIISVIEECNYHKPPTPLLVSFDAEEIRKQAAASTQRFEEGNPLSILDGIFLAIKDDIDCYPHPSKGATTWMHEVRSVEKDAVCVSRLRSCGAIFIGKANMHELGMGTTGNNPNYGTTRNPHAPERYTGGSSSGPAALVASGLCSAALGTDGGGCKSYYLSWSLVYFIYNILMFCGLLKTKAGSVRIPSSLCGVVGLKTTYGRTSMRGSLCGSGTVEIIGPIASTVEDVILVYAAILGSSPEDRISLKPSPPCLPILSSLENENSLGSLRLGKYTEWFNDVHSTDISNVCEDVLNLLSKSHGCETIEIVIPELHEMRTAHIVSIGSETVCFLNPDLKNGKGVKLTYDTRTSMALFRTFSASDYVAAQCLRRRIMHHHMEIFKKVDVIVTPTTGMTAPKIPPSALKDGETDMQVAGYLMRFIIAGNLLGLPAITVPVGYDKQGLPIGLQLIGRPWGEATILRLASAVEELCAKSVKKPASFYDVLKTK
ncbi:fatty acid amide hydrolase isoform X2 [Durio zibethinus]|uniref:Fatty acid amide hydrolase isoform X2 n=1 Tax=Durio zibethinus TaxID=66656 RepID=A0A6P5XCI2_DURZI|nr:fatty acid amide hydrolase isoform X2 [Durio zibethinus]